MAARKPTISLIILFSLIAITCVAQHKKNDDAPLGSDVNITNDLNACIKIIPEQPVEANGLLTLKTSWETEKNIGECGCKSALMSYYVNNISDPKTSKRILEAVISSLGKKEYNFIINADTSIKYKGNYELTISCKNPD